MHKRYHWKYNQTCMMINRHNIYLHSNVLSSEEDVPLEIHLWVEHYIKDTHTQTAVPPHIIVLALSLAPLWVHSVCCCCHWGVGATLSSHSTVHPDPPIVTAICAGATLLGRGRGWRNPLQTVSSLSVWNCAVFTSGGVHLWNAFFLCVCVKKFELMQLYSF